VFVLHAPAIYNDFNCESKPSQNVKLTPAFCFFWARLLVREKSNRGVFADFFFNFIILISNDSGKSNPGQVEKKENFACGVCVRYLALYSPLYYFITRIDRNTEQGTGYVCVAFQRVWMKLATCNMQHASVRAAKIIHSSGGSYT